MRGRTSNRQILGHELQVVPDLTNAPDRVNAAGVELEGEEADGHVDDDCVQVGAGEGGLQPSKHRVDAHAQWDQAAHDRRMDLRHA